MERRKDRNPYAGVLSVTKNKYVTNTIDDRIKKLEQAVFGVE